MSSDTPDPGPFTPVTPRPAATVALLRDGPAGCEVLMVTRSGNSRFMAGLLVFPGGKVDAADIEAGGSEDVGFQLAAIREVFEEAGVLLASDADTDDLAPPERAEAVAGRWRAAVHKGEVPFSRVLEAELLTAGLPHLTYFANWVAPITAKVRFDTRFYAVLAPLELLAAHDGSELVDSRWVTPAEALAQFDAGQVQLAFPTRMNLMLMAGAGRTAAEVMAVLAARQVEKITTEVVRRPEGSLLRIPASAGYPVCELPMEPMG
jgi:8-oxo-dGTP pyrophosphatase MutT (NUDIX family)